MKSPEQGYGFTDLVRRPTARASDLEPQEISASVPDLVRRIIATSELVPVICTFKIVYEAAYAGPRNGRTSRTENAASLCTPGACCG